MPASAVTAEVRLPDASVVCGFHRDADTPSRVFCNWEGSDDEGVTLAARGRPRIVPGTGTVRDARGPVLRYGKTRRFGRLSRRASCRTALRVARTYYERRAVAGWRCAGRRIALEAWKARCTRGDSAVRFDFGA